MAFLRYSVVTVNILQERTRRCERSHKVLVEARAHRQTEWRRFVMLAVVFDGQHDRPSSSRHIGRHCGPSTTIDDRRDGPTWWRQFRWPPTLLCSLCTFSFRDLQHFLSVDVGRHYWLDRVFHAASLAPTARFACHESMLLRYNTRCYFKVRSKADTSHRGATARNQKQTRSSAIAEGPRDAPCQLKPCEMSHKCLLNYIW